MSHFYSVSSIYSQHFNLENTVINFVSRSSKCAQNLIAKYHLLKEIPIRALKCCDYCLGIFLRKLDARAQTVSQFAKIYLKCLRETNLCVRMSPLGRQTGRVIHCLKTSMKAEIIKLKIFSVAHESFAISRVICNFIIKVKAKPSFLFQPQNYDYFHLAAGKK